jgi:hypothetical protein
MMVRTAVLFLIAVLFCACSQQKSKADPKIEVGTKQLLESKTGLKFENEPTRGTGFTDSLGSEYGIVHIKSTITNDGTMPIHLQMALPLEYSYPAPNDSHKFKIVLWPELEEPPGLYSNSAGGVLESFTGQDLKSTNQFNQRLAPGEEYVVTMGSIFPRLPKICSAVAYSFLEYSERRNYSDCDWTLNEEHLTNPQFILGLQVGFCTSGQEYETCVILTCGQITYIED